MCGSDTSCGSYFSQYPFSQTLAVINQWTYTMTIGLNTFYLDQPLTVYRGNFFLIVLSNSGKLAIDTSTNLTYSDMAWQSPYGQIWANLSLNYYLRFYFKTLNNFSSFINTFTLQHKYPFTGLFNLSLTFLSSNTVFQQIVNITDCKLKNII